MQLNKLNLMFFIIKTGRQDNFKDTKGVLRSGKSSRTYNIMAKENRQKE
jgi:hypothetical protein